MLIDSIATSFKFSSNSLYEINVTDEFKMLKNADNNTTIIQFESYIYMSSIAIIL